VNRSIFRSSHLFFVSSPFLSPRYLADTPANGILRNLADRKCGMSKSYAIFHPAWLLQTTLLLSLTPLVFGLLAFFAMVEYTELEQVKVRPTIHTSLKKLQTIHIAF
jgi:hypothetical protein